MFQGEKKEVSLFQKNPKHESLNHRRLQSFVSISTKREDTSCYIITILH